MTDLNVPPTEAPTPLIRRPDMKVFFLLLLIAIVSIAWWKPWSKFSNSATFVDLSPEALDARLIKAEQQLQRAQRLQISLEKKLSDAQSRTGLLRDEVLGVNQRAAILEGNLEEFAKDQNSSRHAVRLEVLELLLILADARLHVDGDLPGALRAMHLANEVAAEISDTQMINLRQSLLQEMQALTNAVDARPLAEAEIDAIEKALPQLSARQPGQADNTAKPGRNGFERLLDAMVQVRSTDEQSLLSLNDRNTAEAALALEIALARSALNSRDNANFHSSVRHMDKWLTRLYADGPLLQDQRIKLTSLAKQDIRLNLPTSGTSLQLLRTMFAHRVQAQ